MTDTSIALLYEKEIAGIDDVDLPALYKQACQALERCHEIDECKDWVDRSAAFKVYAKQVRNDEFVKTAMKIQGRAIRQCGIYLQAIKAQQGGDRRSEEYQQAADRPLIETRTQAAIDVGFSAHQQKTAVRVANIQKSYFCEEP